MRRTIRDMPYRRRHEGLTVGEIYVLKQILRFIPDLIEMSGNLPECPLKTFCQLLLYALFVILLAQLVVERHEVIPVNHENNNRLISSFTDEECWHFLRFRPPELRELFVRCEFPDTVTCDNGVVCPGEHAFCLLLYRISYPSRLLSLQEIFGRDYSQLSSIFKFAVDFMYEKHKDKVHGNVGWYQNRFDIYHRAVMRKIINSPRNPNIGFIPEDVVDVFAFLDGTGLEIARPSNVAQNPFYSGYLHGHYLIYQGISFPDGMVVIEGAFPGYQPDTMVWRDSNMRHELEHIMAERAVEGRPRYKVYADKIYRNSVLVKAAYNLRNNPDGLLPWQESTNRMISDIRVGVEWSFGKIVGRNKFVAFGKTMKLQNSPVSKYYHLAVLIANAHTCMYGCLQTSYFNVEPPTI